MKIALITGASGGIGSAIAVRFAQNGYAVALQYRSNAQGATDAAARFPKDVPYLCVQADLNDASSVAAMIDTVHTRLGAVSVLVNCAGIAPRQTLFSDTTDADCAQVFDTNVYGTMRVTRALIEDLRKTEGSIVNLSSVWGVCGGSCEVLYSASKAAVIGFTKALAKELAPSGVTVNCVAPGLIRTEMNAHLSEEALEAFRLETPLMRFGTPEDVADAVFLLSGMRFVTGQILCCDGGYAI